MPVKDRTYYKRNILISIIISEILVISAFVLAPHQNLSEHKILLNEPVILFDQIPQTRQSPAEHAVPPEIPPVYIPDDIDAYEPLKDVTIIQSSSDQTNESPLNYEGSDNMQFTRSAPRLLYEVVPAGGEDDYHGSLQLSLKINQYGEVIDHRILYNSLECPHCLSSLIKAAYKTKWEPAVVNGIKEDYWVVKSYSFN